MLNTATNKKNDSLSLFSSYVCILSAELVISRRTFLASMGKRGGGGGFYSHSIHNPAYAPDMIDRVCWQGSKSSSQYQYLMPETTAVSYHLQT